MADYKEMFHDIIVESQGPAYIDNNKDANPIMVGYNNGLRHGVLLGITQAFRTLSEEEFIPTEIYSDWHDLVYSEPMQDPQAYRDQVIKERSERE